MGSSSKRFALALRFGALTLLASCSTLPEYARPSVAVVQPEARTATDVIPYSKLEISDFKAASPPAQRGAHAASAGAFTCAWIVSEPPKMQAAVAPDRVSGGYTAAAPAVRFRAEMDRQCSWWNPNGPAPPAYVLQHEQVHFAIVELEARELTETVRALRGRGESPHEAGTALQSALAAAVEEAMNRVLRRSTRFDEDTSLAHRPDRQERWAEEILAELESGP